MLVFENRVRFLSKKKKKNLRAALQIKSHSNSKNSQRKRRRAGRNYDDIFPSGVDQS